PLDDAVRARFKKLDRVEPVRGSVDGSGSTYTFSHQSNASIRAANELLAAGATLAVSKTDGAFTASSIDRSKAEPIFAKNGVHAMAKPAQGATIAVKQPRVALYRPWIGVIDEGWTRWLFEQYEFKFANVYNADVQAGHLRDRFDVVVVPDMGV